MRDQLLDWWRRRKCKRISRYCVTHDVGLWDTQDVRRRCPTFAKAPPPLIASPITVIGLGADCIGESAAIGIGADCIGHPPVPPRAEDGDA